MTDASARKAINVDSKPCKHCKQPIDPEARRCQHCQGHQSWIADQKDPRFQLFVALAILPLIILVGLIPLFVIRKASSSQTSSCPLTVTETAFTLRESGTGERLFVRGVLTNRSDRDLAGVSVRVNSLGEHNELLDTSVEEARPIVVPAGKSVRFRVVALSAVPASKVRKIQVIPERCRPSNNFD